MDSFAPDNKITTIIVGKIWEKVNSNDSAFFGEDPTDFAQSLT
jgi:hypothetical protein